MKRLTDITCTRCRSTVSLAGLDPELALEAVRGSHVCADGTRPAAGSFTRGDRLVAGPGERTKSREELREAHRLADALRPGGALGGWLGGAR
jgi:hypothetical protein